MNEGICVWCGRKSCECGKNGRSEKPTPPPPAKPKPS